MKDKQYLSGLRYYLPDKKNYNLIIVIILIGVMITSIFNFCFIFEEIGNLIEKVNILKIQNQLLSGIIINMAEVIEEILEHLPYEYHI